MYLQIKGCAVVTICAPAYANVFMAYFQEKFIYLLIDAKTLLYLRFIDDIFMIWTKSEKDLIEFLIELDAKHATIKFEFKYSRQQIEFLDALVYRDNNKPQTTLYLRLLIARTICNQSQSILTHLKRALHIAKPCISKEYAQHKMSSRNIQVIFCSNSKRKATIMIRLKNRLKKQGYRKEHFY